MNINQYIQKVAKVHGILTPQCRQNLIWASLNSTGPRIEIGVLAGLSTCCIGVATPKDELILSVDPFEIKNLSDLAKGIIRAVSGSAALKQESFFESWVKQTNAVCQDKNLVPLKGDRLDVLPLVRNNLNGRPAGFLFIDGLHDYESVCLDIEAYLPLVKKNGLVAFHDYREDWGVFRAVNEAIERGELEKVRDNYLLVTRKTS